MQLANYSHHFSGLPGIICIQRREEALLLLALPPSYSQGSDLRLILSKWTIEVMACCPSTIYCMSFVDCTKWQTDRLKGNLEQAHWTGVLQWLIFFPYLFKWIAKDRSSFMMIALFCKQNKMHFSRHVSIWLVCHSPPINFVFELN